MRKIVLLVTLFVVFAMGITIYADEGISISINGAGVTFTDTKPFINENGRTLVPFRAVLESFGASVDWDSESNTAIATKGDIVVKIPAGKKYIIKNNEKIENDTKSINKSGHIYLPIRAVLESFNATVNWDNNTRTVAVTTAEADKETGSSSEIPSNKYEELDSTNKIMNENMEYTNNGEKVYIPSGKNNALDLKHLLETYDEYEYDAYNIKVCLPENSESIANPNGSAVVINNKDIPIQLSFWKPTDMADEGYTFKEYLKFKLGRTEESPKSKTYFYSKSLLEIYNQNVILNGNTVTTLKIARIVHSISPEIHIEYIIQTKDNCYGLNITADSKYSQSVKEILGSYRIKDLFGEGNDAAVLYRDELLELPESLRINTSGL